MEYRPAAPASCPGASLAGMRMQASRRIQETADFHLKHVRGCDITILGARTTSSPVEE